jgi:hypothetical protein
LKALFFDVDVERFILCMKRSLKYSSVHQSRHVGCSILKWELNFQCNGQFAIEVLDTAPILARWLQYVDGGLNFQGCGRFVIEVLDTAPILACWLQYFDVGTKFSRQRVVCHPSLGYSTIFGPLSAL